MSALVDSLACSLKPRELLALLNGIARLRYYGDAEISVAFLQEQLFSTVPAEAALAQARRYLSRTLCRASPPAVCDLVFLRRPRSRRFVRTRRSWRARLTRTGTCRISSSTSRP